MCGERRTYVYKWMTTASARGVRLSGVSAQQWYEGPSHRMPDSVLVEFIITTYVKTYAKVGRIAGIPTLGLRP